MKQTHFFAAVVTAGMMCLSTFSVQGYAGTDNSKDVVETVIGDIDQNGVVDPADAIAILKINANENAYSENQIKVADVNADGAITAEDATMVLTFYAKTMAGMSPVWNSNAIFTFSDNNMKCKKNDENYTGMIVNADSDVYYYQDGIASKGLAKRFKRLWRNNKTFHYKVNLIRYADDFIITGRDKELLENEVKPIVIEFLKERGLTLSEEKTTITNIYDGFDFLGFNVRKFGKKLYTSPSKDAQKRFRAKISDIVKGHKMCKQESLIRMLNPVITGWGNYYRYGASTDAFHGCDYHIYNLTKKWALRRHPKKRKSWVADRYWHEIRGRKWTFAWKYETKSMKVNYLTLKRLSDIHYTPYKQVKGEANPFDPEYDDYFSQRKEQQMLESLKGRKSLLYLWNKQNRICPLCGKEIDCTKAWNVNEISVGGSIVRQLVHNNCYKRNKRKC